MLVSSAAPVTASRAGVPHSGPLPAVASPQVRQLPFDVGMLPAEHLQPLAGAA
jgi:hypothetical protein